MHHGIGKVPTPDIRPGTYPPPPTVVASNGGHRNTYGSKAGATHPTGMLSCLLFYFTSWNCIDLVYILFFPAITVHVVVRTHVRSNKTEIRK